MVQQWQLWSIFAFALASALGPWARSQDAERLPMAFQLPCMLLAVVALAGVPWLLWREYRVGGLSHAALMFLGAWGGALVLTTLFSVATVYIARKLAAHSTEPAAKFAWFLQTCLQIASLVAVPWSAYKIYGST